VVAEVCKRHMRPNEEVIKFSDVMSVNTSLSAAHIRCTVMGVTAIVDSSAEAGSILDWFIKATVY
jgi:hypothetical protein